MDEVLTMLYRGILGREPDSAGLGHYLRSAENGLGLEEIVRSLLASDEAVLRRLRTAREPRWQARKAAPARPVCFLHILKTGGTAIVNALRRLLPPELCLTGLFLDHLVGAPGYMLDGSALIAGHLPYEAVDLLPAEGAICMVLRDPVERTLSYYSHLSRDLNVRRADPDFSLERFVHSPGWRPHSSNHQARQLGHRIGLVSVWEDFSPRERLESMGLLCPVDSPHPLDALFHSTPLDLPDDELLHQASETLGSVDVVGVTEQLDSCFRKMAALLGFADPPALLPGNVASDRVRRANVPTALLDTILENNAIDLALYERALSLQDVLPVDDLGEHIAGDSRRAVQRPCPVTASTRGRSGSRPR